MRICPACSASYPGEVRVCPTCGASFSSAGPYVDLTVDSISREGPRFAGKAAHMLVAVEESHFWFGQRALLVANTVATCFPEARTLLDVGCGGGCVLAAISRRFPQLTVAGGDIDVDALLRARDRLPDARLYRMTAERIPFESEFDVVCCLDVLEHVEDDVSALREMYRAVRPRGGLIVAVPQYPWLWSAHDERSEHVRRYTRTELQHKIEAVGWRTLYTTSFVTILFPLMVASRILMRRSMDPGTLRELNPPRGMNAPLQAIMHVERLAIEAGLRMPFGGSRLLVARKGVTS